ncbi:protocatechuate 3,4-dioxygenase subunit alpha [Spiractinospora alimapuensis]|uniref:protocatechuate 3,4-dioxygenase subunit alpha n=1 Tax=Spiractinospora alimapuensis TaxID=2820884 RepID=UPI001F293694|nr:protocatechuate 3,4-dioxygenase subunit alpha [Spiractinospora alimapuensis]QVQ53569.1 protocatechuate 3,4-dioxygenase subunit alpha [Spiractinospora alimapuensis]
MSATSQTTPSQTVGPYLHIGLPWDGGPYAADADAPNAFWIRGTVYDGEGTPVRDALIETWQADPDGRFNHPDDPRGAMTYPGFRGFARSDTRDGGAYAVRTLKPGVVPGPAGPQAPHIDVSVFARGMLHRVVTRIYFPEEVEANASDPVLSAITEEDARATLVATKADDGYTFDIRIQGGPTGRETVFFDI